MGAWGHGNLDNDSARDFLADFSEVQFLRVIELLKHPRSHKFDCEEIDELFGLIEIIFVLHEKEMLGWAPERKEFRNLFRPYLKRWDTYHKEWGGGIDAERRKVIKETFMKLVAVIRDKNP